MSIVSVPTVTLSNGVRMPGIGLGTWPMDDAQAAGAVASALAAGYRLIDTAENYGNEHGVGEGFRASGVARDEVFLTTKFNRQWHSKDGVRQACEASLRRLGMDYIDLFLIHWPIPDQDRYVEAFQGMTALVEAGLVRAIGTSNFKVAHLQRLFDAGLVPQVNQIQLDPYHLRPDIVAVHRDRGIVTEAWGPLGRAGSGMINDPAIAAIARRHDRTPAQVLLRWSVQSGYVPVPKSADPARQAQNLSVFDFTLSDEDMAAIDRLDRHDPQMLDSDVYGH
ncbi:aldo/keto reductase [Castellaniella sp. S9]|uniref:aldo/keto reductase n=1 Tax=Castellaniella sp. S9 TaxID=2993652 RepID=UPI0022B3C845|nr:aldo/keto reductase [Castellaniella sp. S9]